MEGCEAAAIPHLDHQSNIKDFPSLHFTSIFHQLRASWILHLFPAPASAKPQAANQAHHPEPRVSPRSQTIHAPQQSMLGERIFHPIVTVFWAEGGHDAYANALICRFIDEQLQLEADAREALPYVSCIMHVCAATILILVFRNSRTAQRL